MSLHDLGTVERLALPARADEWLATLPGPIAVRVVGEDSSRWRVVSGLLHGNERSGLHAIHAVLREGLVPATNTLFLLGGIEAALTEPRLTHRFVPGRRDLNRCFAPPFAGPDGEVARAMLQAVIDVAPEAVVDLHNNTGHNPPYGVGTVASTAQLGLVSLFAPRFVWNRIELATFTNALEHRTAAATIECGRAGDPAADEVATEGLRRFLRLDRMPLVEPGPQMQVLGEPVRVELAPGLSLAFGDHRISGAALTFDEDIDRHNFQLLPEGTRIGWVAGDAPWPLVAIDESLQDVSHDYFRLDGKALVTRRPLMPVMMTTHPTIAVEDCLFYAVRPLGS